MSEAVPAGWCSATLADCVLPVPSLDPAERPDEEFTYCDISAIDNDAGKVVAPKLLKGQDAPSRARQAVRAGDVLFSSVRPGLRAIARVPDITNPVASTGFCVLRAAQGIDGTYLFHLLRSDKFLQQVLPLQRGVSYPAVRDADVLNQPVLMPPAAEQTRIVTKLEELLSELDVGVAELKAAQKKLMQYRQSLLKAAVDGSLTAAWRARPENQTPAETGAQLLARILKERRARWEAQQLAKFEAQGKTPPKEWQARYPVPVAPDTTDLHQLPAGWTWASVAQLATLLSGHTPKDAGDHASPTGLVPWFKVSDMNHDGNKEQLVAAQSAFDPATAESLGLKVAPAGTIVFPKRGGAIATNKKRRLGVAASYDLNMMGLVPLEPVAEWLWWWFSGIDLSRLSDGSNVPQINNPDIAPLPVPLPPVGEQEKIIAILSAQTASVRALAESMNLLLRQSTAQRQNILRAAFSGQLVLQEPADEPASALLARIRAERDAATAAPKRASRRRAQVATTP